jgi:shikimate kinase
MGSGKTTIGRLVATELGLEFHDCDEDLEKSTGASVNLIFDVEGEKGFREREAQLLRNISQKSGLLIATGGGIVTRARNRKLLQSTGLVVWLKTTVHQQIDRLSHDKSRPLLQTENREVVLRKLASVRDPLYQELADLVFTSPNKNSKFSASSLCKQIQYHWKSGLSGEYRAQN